MSFRLRHISPKTKILFLASLLILLPGALLSYFGLQSVNQRIDSLQAHYRSTVGLVADKTELEILHAEEGARVFILESPLRFRGAKDVQEWLKRLQSTNPFLKHPFVVRSNGGVLSTMISRGWTRSKPVISLRSPMATSDFRSAEEAEFRKQDLTEALRLYRLALRSTTWAQDRAIVHARIGRCNFKLHRYRESIAEYESILSLKADSLVVGLIPAPVVAFSQIADAHLALGDSINYAASMVRLSGHLVQSPWDVESGEYVFYLSMAHEALHHAPENARLDTVLEKLTGDILDQARLLNIFTEKVLPKIRSTPQSRTHSELQPQHFFIQSKDSAVQFGFLGVPGLLEDSSFIGLGYQFRPDYVTTKLIPNVVHSAEVEPGVLMVVLNERDSLLFGSDRPRTANQLASQPFTEVFPLWKVVLFDQQGRTIEDLLGSERRLYLVLFGGIVLLMAVGIFLTIRAAAHEAEVSRLKTEFVSNVSHELKTPLTLIRMFGETLESGLVVDEAQRKEFSGIIRKESERLTHLINNVLDFSKMDAGSKEYRFEEADLVDVVRATLEAYTFHIRDLGFDIDSQFPSEPIPVLIDKDAISQATLNLLSNATKYSDTARYIRLLVTQSGSTAMISVADHGIGIPQELLGKIFEKFYRIPCDKTRASRGAGLGLTLTRHIVEAHQGKIDVQSTIGKGSVFTISLPVQHGAIA